MCDRIFQLVFGEYRARVTLRGLEVRDRRGVPEELRGQVFPWVTLLPGRSTLWRPHDSLGEPISINDCAVKLRISDTRKVALIQRLRERALARAWRDGSLDLTVRFTRALRDHIAARIIVVVMTLAMVGGLFLMFRTGIQNPFSWPTGPMPTHVLVALILCLTGVGLMYLGPLLIFLVVAFKPAPEAVHAMRCTHEIVEFEFAGGRTRCELWRDLDRIRSAGPSEMGLFFAVGGEVRMTDLRKVRPLLAVINRQVLPHKATKREHQRSQMIHIAKTFTFLFVPSGLAFAWYMTTYFPGTFPPNAPGNSFWGIFLLIAVPLPLLFWIFVFAERINWRRIGRARGRRSAPTSDF